MTDLKLLEELSNAFGPSGFEEEAVKIVGQYCEGLIIENDAMNNLYIHGRHNAPGRPMVMLDAHSDEVGFMVQSIHENGQLGIIALGGFVPTNIPAHTVLVRTSSGKLCKGITASKPVHFLSAAERANAAIDIDTITIDVGASSRKEAMELFGIRIGDPVVPEATFEYIKETGVCFGKAFDDRVGCACVAQIMKNLGAGKECKVNVTGVISSQEEVGLRGAAVSALKVQPDIAIVFEGTPADDSFSGGGMAQGAMHKGVQVRHADSTYLANPVFTRIVGELAEKHSIPVQFAVRRGGGTNAAKISLAGKAVPTLILGVPVRYVHTHYNYCSVADIDAAIKLGTELLQVLDQQMVDTILKKDLLG